MHVSTRSHRLGNANDATMGSQVRSSFSLSLASDVLSFLFSGFYSFASLTQRLSRMFPLEAQTAVVFCGPVFWCTEQSSSFPCQVGSVSTVKAPPKGSAWVRSGSFFCAALLHPSLQGLAICFTTVETNHQLVSSKSYRCIQSFQLKLLLCPAM